MVQPHTEPLLLYRIYYAAGWEKGVEKYFHRSITFRPTAHNRTCRQTKGYLTLFDTHLLPHATLGYARAIKNQRPGIADSLDKVLLDERLQIIADGALARIRQYLLNILHPAIAELPNTREYCALPDCRII